MELEEWYDYVACAECDTVLDSNEDVVFVIDGDLCLCVDCATKRGANYDATSRAWTAVPNLSGLA